MLNPSVPRGLFSHRRQERGITIAMLALFIVVLFTIAALAIDVGVLYTARTSAQHAADAAALAGAYTFLNPNANQPSAAQKAAVNIAGQNLILGQNVTIAPSDVSVDSPNRRVTVTVSRLAGSGVTTFFAKVIGINAVDVQTKATAEASKRPTGAYCLKPFFIPNTAMSTKAESAACTSGEVLLDASANPTAFALGQVGQSFPTSSGLWSEASPSQWGVLDLTNDNNKNRGLSCTIPNCVNECGVSTPPFCSSQIDTYTGVSVGIVKPAIDQLIGSPPDQWQGVSEYVSASTGNVTDTSRSLVTVVVWDDCAGPLGHGTNVTVRVLGYANAFIDRVQGKTVQAHFVGVAGCPPGGGTGGGTGPMAVPVRLVQTP